MEQNYLGRDVAGRIFDVLRLSVFGIVVLWGAAVLSNAPASAHHVRKSTDDTSGISIPNLTHGQLHVMARYDGAILALADRQVQPAIEARTLQNYINLQFAYCLWGLVPGSLSDEGNPFNECSHAYLAASKALLDRLQKSDDTRDRANALADEINVAMLADTTALAICAHSFEPFNTAQIIMPAWGDLMFNPLGVLLAVFIVIASGAAFLTARKMQRSPSNPQ